MWAEHLAASCLSPPAVRGYRQAGSPDLGKFRALGTADRQNVTDYSFLPPTPENLAQLRPEIPAGYTQVSSADLFGPEPKTK